MREDNEKAGKTWYWLYNTARNLWYIKEYDYTTADVLGEPTSTVTNVYGSTVWRDLLTKHGDTTITYDTIGNTLNDGTWSYTWERGRQLKSMSNGTTTWNMTYDPDGLRTSRTDGTNTYYYYYSEGLLTYMKYNALVMRFTYDANGNPVSMTYNGNIYFYVLNLQGDVMALLDASGNEVVSYHYNAWGELLSTTASTTGMLYSLALYNPLRYRGYVYDRETGLYYLQSRYYNPEICRFINADAYLYTGNSVFGLNLFAYCLNNPVNYWDPNGQEPITATLTVAGIAAALVVVAGIAVVSYYTINALWVVGEWLADLYLSKQEEKTSSKKSKEPDPPDVTYPGNNPAEAPEGYVWTGPDEQGGKRGGYKNPNGKDSWHPDLNHPDGIEPHWDYNDSSGHKWRVFPDRIELVK